MRDEEGKQQEVVDVLGRRKDICCVHEVQYEDEGSRMMGSGEEK